eukprot:gene13713-19608_t
MALAVGFKLFPEHWQGSSKNHLFQRLVADTRVKKVILRRDNLLAMYVSKLRADKTGDYIGVPLDGVDISVNTPQNSPSRPPLSFSELSSPNFYTCYFLYNAHAYYGPGWTPHPLVTGQDESSVHRVSYEDLVSEERGSSTMRSILHFLGVDETIDPKPLEVTVRQTRASLHEGVRNYEDLKFAFQCTDVATCFE